MPVLNEVLSDVEVRVLGSLVEKQITTPDYYPLSLNSLTLACNQKSNRDPVVFLEEKTVVHALEHLFELRLAVRVLSADSRVPKYRHMLPDTIPLDAQEIAVLCVLMLRGPLTVGEIRGCTGRLHEFEGLAAVEETLSRLAARQPAPLVTQLPRQPGRKESRYAHLLAGEPSVPAPEAAARLEPAALEARAESGRLARLETEVAELRGAVLAMREELARFRASFE